MKKIQPFILAGMLIISAGQFKLQTMQIQANTYPVKNINISINRPPADVYQFAANPENFPKWVKFVKSISRQGENWVAESDLGKLKIKFTPKNDFGIIDHDVTLANGETVTNHMRVIRNNKGSEFIFTLFRLPGRTDQEYEADAKAVSTDLQQLKTILEGK
jgi:hypothetical protein